MQWPYIHDTRADAPDPNAVKVDELFRAHTIEEIRRTELSTRYRPDIPPCPHSSFVKAEHREEEAGAASDGGV